MFYKSHISGIRFVGAAVLLLLDGIILIWNILLVVIDDGLGNLVWHNSCAFALFGIAIGGGPALMAVWS